MNIQCDRCHRTFELDDQKLAGVPAVECVCGNTLAVFVSGSKHRHMGKYLLINRIAVGGMGEIWYGKVSGVEGFEKEVAIKRMLPHLSADRDFINMMVKEAKLTVLLTHPNIVGVIDLSKEGDEYYIAMEYVPGITIGAILEQARAANMMLPWEAAVYMTMQILRGLGYAHRLPSPSGGGYLTILHRDITPQNIMVTQHAFVKIADFGIAKAVNEISTTSPGMIKGKLGYIAPEQLEGREPDQRVDLFCAAILLWEMCAVRRLFKGTTEIDTFRLISECNIPPLSNFRSDVPPAVEAVLLKGLSRNPDDRYPRAEEFNAALSQAIAPRTADDLNNLTAQFFQDHSEFFAGIAAHKIPQDADAAALGGDEPTRNINVGLSRRLSSVDMFVTENAKKQRWPIYAGVGAALVLALAGGGVYAWRVNQQAVEEETSTNAPPEPPPIPAAKPAVAPAVAPAVVPSAVPSPTAAPSGAPPPMSNVPAQPPQGKSPEPHRERRLKPLSGAEIQSVVQNHQASILGCLRNIDKSNSPGQVNARITIEPSGEVTEVEFSPALPSKNIDACLTQSLKKMRFRRSLGPAMQVTIPLRIEVH